MARFVPKLATPEVSPKTEVTTLLARAGGWRLAGVLVAVAGLLSTAVAASIHELPSAAESEDGLWNRVDAAARDQAPSGDRSGFLYELDRVGFDTAMNRAPFESSPAAASLTILITLPLPDGSFERFRVEESPIMERRLARRFPQLKTYSLRGVDSPTYVGRMDTGPRGMHAMLLTDFGAVLINPDREQDQRFYRSWIDRFTATELEGAFCGVSELSAADPTMPRGSSGLPAGGRPFGFTAPIPGANPSGSTLRTYRLAVATTGEYYAGRDMGGGDADVMASIMTVVNRVNLVYEAEVAIRFMLIGNNNQLLFTDPMTDGYSNNAPCTMRNENTPIINATINVGDYDVGHVFGSAGGGGCAGGSVVCVNNNKGNGASGLRTDLAPDQEGFSGYRLVAHEMGHQFSAGHTWSGSNGSCSAGQFSANNAYEPLSGTTLMAYAGICGPDNITGGPDDPYFHTRSFDQIVNFSTGAGDACAAKNGTGNSIPVVDAGVNYTIPTETPFKLTGSANDADGQPLTYAWEQFDLAPARISPLVDQGDNPLFRSFIPVTTPTRIFPQLSDILNGTTTLGELLPTTERMLNFRLTARDNQPAGGGVDWDAMKVTTEGDPFFVTSPNGGEVLNAGCTAPVAWTVGGGDVAANVDLSLSTNGGLDFSALLPNTANDGSAVVDLPCLASTTARVQAEAVGNIFFDISDGDFEIEENAPQISPSALGGEVDDLCMFEVTFDASVTDDCALNAGDVTVSVSLLTGNATLGAPNVNIVQGDAQTVNVDGSVLVSDLTSSPATVRVEVDGTDLCGLQTIDTVDADVVDTTPPMIDVELTPDLLWPPNHKMVDILADVTVTDNCPVIGFVLESVVSSEPDDAQGGGDGHTVDDIQGVDAGTADLEFQLRAERQGGGPGRVYTANYEVEDGSGNTASDSAEVLVPKKSPKN